MSTAFYPPSWYAATLNEAVLQSALDGEVRAHVCVIGAGYTGLSAAIALAERGYSVIVLEAKRVGWGASGRNGGQMIHGITGLDRMKKHWGRETVATLDNMAFEGNRIIRQRVQKYNIECDLKMGWLEAAIKPRHMVSLEAEAKHFAATGKVSNFQLLDQAQMQDMLGTKRYIGGLLNKDDGHLHPLKLARGEAKAAMSLGVRIFEGSPVLSLEAGEPAIIRTPGGKVTADHVIIAANINHSLAPKSAAGFAFPAGSFIMATEPLSAAFTARVNADNFAVCDAANVIDYFRYSNDGRLIFGGRCNYSGRKPASIKAALLPRLGKIWPELADVKIDYQWGGTLGVSLSETPLFGLEGANVWRAGAYSGHGVNVAHLAGVILAEAIAGKVERFDLFAKMPTRRLRMGNIVGRELVALYIFWLRLKDSL